MQNQYNTIIVGGGIAGLVAALELLTLSNQKVLIIDKDSPDRIGGLARWAFGGMALCGTNEQQRQNIPDNPERLLADWHSFAQFESHDYWPKQWAKVYAQQNHDMVYVWLKSLGASFLPAVNWVERGLNGEGNSLPRYHILWGTGWHLVSLIMQHLLPYIESKRLVILHQHTATNLIHAQQKVTGVHVENLVNNNEFTVNAEHTILACGGINGCLEQVEKHWPAYMPAQPSSMLNGASPLSDGKLHEKVAQLGGNITRTEHMWNYAAGIKHPQAEFEHHGLSLIPAKSALWLNHMGERIGPMPLVTGFDTNDLCQQVAAQEKPWTWQVMNWRIAAKELAVSGSLHNPAIRNKKLLQLVKEMVFGNHRLIKQLAEECDDFIVADSVERLVEKMNQQTDSNYLTAEALHRTIDSFDRQFSNGKALHNDDQLRRIMHCRQWKSDKLRTCKPKPIKASNAGPLIAIKVQLISRKSLGGMQTNLSGQVLTEQNNVIAGLYGIGEAAGFGGGGANGFRSLEGTFLSSCILTARITAQAIVN